MNMMRWEKHSILGSTLILREKSQWFSEQANTEVMRAESSDIQGSSDQGPDPKWAEAPAAGRRHHRAHPRSQHHNRPAVHADAVHPTTDRHFTFRWVTLPGALAMQNEGNWIANAKNAIL